MTVRAGKARLGFGPSDSCAPTGAPGRIDGGNEDDTTEKVV